VRGAACVAAMAALVLVPTSALANNRAEEEAAPAPPAIELASEQAAVWQGEVDYWNRVNSRDLEGYLDLWHSDFTGWPCGAERPADLSGLEAFAEDWFAGMAARGQRTTPTAEAVIVKDAFAVTYLSALTEWHEPDGRKATKREKFVHTWQSTPEGWKIIGGMCAPLEAYDAAVTASSEREVWTIFPADRSLTHAEDGVVLADGRLLVGDWDYGLVALSLDGTKRPFGSFVDAGFRTKPDPMWNSPNGVSWEPDMRNVLVADITGGHIYRVDTQTEAVERIYDHPFGVNAVVRDPSGAIWFTQSTENSAGEDSEDRMFAAADKPLGDGAVWRIAPGEVGKSKPVAIKVVDGLDFANGIAFDAARGRLYVAEIVGSRVLSFAVDRKNGALSDRRVLAELPTPDNLELDDKGNLWVASPFANAVFVIDPDTGMARKVFEPTPVTSARIVAETERRIAAGDPILPLLTSEMWGPMPGLITGVILSRDGGPVYVSGLGDALVKLDRNPTSAGLPNEDHERDGIGQALENRTAVILASLRSGDVRKVLDLYTDDALYSPSSDSLLTKEAELSAFWQAVIDSPATTATLEVLRVERLSADAFVEIQKYDVLDGTGARMFGGYASLLWRKVEGRWLMAADVSN